jgi:hypothetical protein
MLDLSPLKNGANFGPHESRARRQPALKIKRLSMKYAVLLALASIGLASAASAGTVVVPGQYANTEAPSDGLVILRGANHHEQFQFKAASFGSAPMTISAASFRYDAQVSDFYFPTMDFNFGSDFLVQIGTATNSMANRSTTFAANLGADTETVLSGAQTITMAVDGHAGQTKGFGITFNFLTPFNYDPSKGDLVLDMYLPDVGLYADMDYVPDYVPAASQLGVVYAGDHSATGGVYSGGPVTQFTFAPLVAGGVPEPASWALMIAGLGGVGAALRRRRLSAALA